MVLTAEYRAKIVLMLPLYIEHDRLISLLSDGQ